MALTLNGSSDKVSIATAVANPDSSVVMMHTVFRPNSTTPQQNFIAIDRESGGNGPILCIYLPGSTAAPQAFWRGDDLSNVNVNGAATISTTAFNSCQAIFEEGGNLSLYRDGVADGSTTGLSAAATHNNLGGTRMGFLQNGGAGSQFFAGDYGIGAIWSDTTGLTAGELLALGKGAHPMLVRPQALVACVELIGGRMIDWLGTGFTLTGGSAVSTHPRTYRPGRITLGIPSAGGTPTETANLSGIAGSGAAGTLAKSLSKALTGIAGTAAAGTLAKTIAKTLTGAAGTGAAGTLSPTIAVNTANLTGIAGTGAAGTVTAVQAGTNVTLSGVTGTGAAGTLAATAASGEITLQGVFGTGQAGTVQLAGDIGAAVGGGWVPRHQEYRKGERRERGLEWSTRDRRAVRRSLERAYAKMLGEEPATPEQAAERQVAAEIVKPFVTASHDTALPPRQAVDWAALMRNADAARQLLALYSKERLDLDIRRRVAAILLLSV